jgi:hypothetical protein
MTFLQGFNNKIIIGEQELNRHSCNNNMLPFSFEFECV